MYPKYHFLIGLLFSILLFLLFPNISLLGLLLILTSTVLIDVDHYIYFVYKKKSFNLKRAYVWFKEVKLIFLKKSEKEVYSYKWPVMFFHNIESLALILLLFSFEPVFGFILIGALLHLFLDFLENLYLGFPLTIKSSLIFLLIRNRKKREIDF